MPARYVKSADIQFRLITLKYIQFFPPGMYACCLTIGCLAVVTVVSQKKILEDFLCYYGSHSAIGGRERKEMVCFGPSLSPQAMVVYVAPKRHDGKIDNFMFMSDPLRGSAVT